MTRPNRRISPLTVVRPTALPANTILETDPQSIATGADALVRTLGALGVDMYFGVPRPPVMPVLDAVARDTSVRLVEPRHEMHAAFEAAGFHLATGHVPAVVIAAGAGAMNVVDGVAAARRARVPMIVVVGDEAAESTARRGVQAVGSDGVGIERVLTGIARGVFRVINAASVAAAAMAAFERATDPRLPGPCVIVLPPEHASSRCRLPAMRVARRSTTLSDMPPSRDVLNTLAGRLRAARRPLVFVGAGCREASGAVLELVESMQAPFVTTPGAKGMLPETHPLSLRNAGTASSMWARSYCAAGPDFVLALGTDLDDPDTAGTPPVEAGGTLVHVTSEPVLVGRQYENAFAISCDVLAFARSFRESVRAHGGSPVGQALALATRSTPAFETPDFDRDVSEPIAAHRVMADLEDAVPADTTFVSALGKPMLVALHYLTSGGLRRFVSTDPRSSTASGIAASVGVALGDPSRTVVCLCGERDIQTAGFEIVVAIEHRLRIVFAVFDASRSDPVHRKGRIRPRVDYVQWAHALGIRGARIERPGDIDRALLDRLTDGGLPALLDIRCDPNPSRGLRRGGRSAGSLDRLGRDGSRNVTAG